MFDVNNINNKYLECAKYLIENGANLDLEMASGITIRDLLKSMHKSFLENYEEFENEDPLNVKEAIDN
jgi:hypothetical protein